MITLPAHIPKPMKMGWVQQPGYGFMTNRWSGLVTEGESTIQTVSNTKSVVYDGVDEYSQVANSTDFDSASKLTVNVWCRSTATGSGTAFDGIVNKRGSGSQWSWNIRRIQASPWETAEFLVIGGTVTKFKLLYAKSFSIFGTGEGWHMLTMRWDGTESAEADKLAGFVDGSKETDPTRMAINDSFSSMDVSTAPITIGSSWTGSPNNPFPGDIDEPMIWPGVALTDEQISDIYDAYTSGNAFDPRTDGGSYDQSDGLVSWWRMGDDASDTSSTIIDQEGPHDLTNTNLESGDIQTDAPP